MSPSDELIEIQEFFRRNDPSLVLKGFSEDVATFQLLDCDGYRLGYLTFEDVQTLCVTPGGWESFDQLAVYDKGDFPSSFSWLSEIIPNGYRLVTLKVLDDTAAESVLPTLGNWTGGYLICRALRFERETVPGR